MDFLQRMRERRATMPEWAPAAADIVELTETPYGPMRFLVRPVDPGERAAWKVRGLQTMESAARAMAKLKATGTTLAEGDSPDALGALIASTVKGMADTAEAKVKHQHGLRVWLLSRGVVGIGLTNDGVQTWRRYEPVMLAADASDPGEDAAPDAVIRPWVVELVMLGDAALEAVTTRIDALTGVE